MLQLVQVCLKTDIQRATCLFHSSLQQEDWLDLDLCQLVTVDC